MKNSTILSALNMRFIPIPMVLGFFTLFSLSAPVLANPEAGADHSRLRTIVYLTSNSPLAPTVLRSVTVVCPVAGFTVARADADFGLFIDTGYTVGFAAYGITRNATSLEGSSYYHWLEGESPDFFDFTDGGMSRSDSCRAGESVTYRFVAYRYTGLLDGSFARTPALEVVAYRDRY